MSKLDTWMPFYVGDYLADTTRLTTWQHGAYLLLILDSWKSGPPPDDDVVLAQITRQSVKEWQRSRPALEPKFQITDGHWHHKRVGAESTRAARISEERKQAGAVGGSKSAANREAKRQANGKQKNSKEEANDEANAKQTSQQTSTQSQLQRSKERSTPTPTSVGFERFWDAWPSHKRKADREGCFALWQRRNLEPETEPILTHVAARRRSADWTKDDGQYVPAPLVYLRGRQYEALKTSGLESAGSTQVAL